jgi:hypothetical protein
MKDGSMMNNAAWIVHQRRTYAGRYRYFRAIHDFLRYDARYRIFLMEELFRKHDIPFERQRVFELGFGTGSLLLQGTERGEDATGFKAGEDRSREQRGGAKPGGEAGKTYRCRAAPGQWLGPTPAQ